jgi:hypothetical protein
LERALWSNPTTKRHRLRLRLWSKTMSSAHVVDRGAGFDRYVIGDTIDRLTHTSPLGFVKLDLEGSELRALMGAVDVLTTWKPALALCLYHKEEDPVTIPAFLHGLHLGYSVPRIAGKYPIGVWRRAN